MMRYRRAVLGLLGSVFRSSSGSTLLWMIGALVVLGSVAAGVALMSPSASNQVVMDNYKDQAYYASLSGINFAKSLNDASMSNLANKTTFISLSDNVGYDLSIGSPVAGAYPVTSLGKVIVNNVYAANYYIGPIEIVPMSSGGGDIPDNPAVPDANYSGAKFSFSGNYTGDAIVNTAYFNGGVNISGSIYYMNDGSKCMEIYGNSVGSTDGSSTICSNTCIKLLGNVTVYGNVVGQGNVRLESGSVYGNVTTGGDAYLAPWNGYIYKLSSDSDSGDLNYYGTVNSDGIKNIAGDIIKLSKKPSQCKGFSLPKHLVVTPTKDDPNYGDTYIFYGTDIDDTTTYAFPSLTTGGGARTCFDLSGEKKYVNIFVKGGMNFGSSIYIRTSSDSDCFDKSNKLTRSNYNSEKFINAAKKIYIDVNGKAKFSGDGHAWVGTLFVKDGIQTEGTFTSVGALYSNGAIDTNGDTLTYFVKSDFANTNWSK